jgi:hypothetical protein
MQRSGFWLLLLEKMAFGGIGNLGHQCRLFLFCSKYDEFRPIYN